MSLPMQLNVMVTSEYLSDKGAEKLERVFNKALEQLDLQDMLLSVLLCDDGQMKDFNTRYRGKKSTTDVLSFAAQEGQALKGLEDVLGDLVISVERAKEQAEEHGHRLDEELIVLFVHGLFHLLGFDHERSAEDARKQAEAEMGLLSVLSIDPKIALIGRTGCLAQDVA